jgi:hypothetical protein
LYFLEIRFTVLCICRPLQFTRKLCVCACPPRAKPQYEAGQCCPAPHLQQNVVVQRLETPSCYLAQEIDFTYYCIHTNDTACELQLLGHSALLSDYTGQVGSSGNTSDLHSGGDRFDLGRNTDHLLFSSSNRNSSLT